MPILLKYIHILITITFSLTTFSIEAQQVKLIKKKYGSFYEEYYTLKNDTSIKHGRYFRKYKKDIIEQGNYKQGVKDGRWAYFSLEGVFEFEYDYNKKKVSNMAARHSEEDFKETPVLFHGSPIIPYLYMVTRVRYPSEAKNKDITGKIILALNIDKNGKLTSLYIKEKLHPSLDHEVMKVAKTFPLHWEWIPASFHGQPINSQYTIEIEFELYN
jgi:TonB family protein